MFFSLKNTNYALNRLRKPKTCESPISGLKIHLHMQFAASNIYTLVDGSIFTYVLLIPHREQ